jgi:hypothetical protein
MFTPCQTIHGSWMWVDHFVSCLQSNKKQKKIKTPLEQVLLPDGQILSRGILLPKAII